MSGGRWFSANPSKAWGEKFFLAYTPIWIAEMALVSRGGLLLGAGDVAHLSFGLLVAAPLVLYPALFRDESHLGRRWYQTYWFKMNLWIGVFGFVGSYFLSEYFFDVLGMVYVYPTVDWNLDAALVGSGEQRVPIIMYLLTQAYFMTYHSAAVVLMRRVRTSVVGRSRFAWPLTIFAAAYGFAWAETFFMTQAGIEDQFYYKDLPRMLRYGSLFYACYFIVSFPMVYRLDEEPGDDWSPGRTCIEALAAGMLVFVLLDAWTRVIGPLA